jgi:hypothetical protein
MEKINTDNEYEIARRLKEYRAAVCEFIDYLYEYRSDMRDDIKTIEEMILIRKKQSTLKPREYYEDKRKYDECEKAFTDKLDSLTFENLITSEAKKLGLYKNSTIEIRNNLNVTAHLLSDIKPSEAEKIVEAKDKYLTFRKDTDFCNFLTGSLFHDLDLALIEFFGAFTDVSDMERTLSKPQPQPQPQPQPKADPAKDITNHFDRAPIGEVIEHFKDLEKYMGNGEFIEWIKLAFELRQIPKPEQKFSLNGQFLKKDIRHIFHSYWKKKGIKGNKSEYVKLLSDYFKDFEFDNTMNNFHK